MDPRILRSRKSLHRAFLELLEQKPIDQITIRDIADQSGVGYTTFFRHHPSKEAMLSEIVAQQIQNLLIPALPVLDGGDRKAAATAIFSHVHEHRALWATLLTGGAAPLVREEFLRLARDIASVRLPPTDWVPADIGLGLLVSGTIELLTMWLRQSDPLPTKRIVEIYNRIILAPIMDANQFAMPERKADRKPAHSPRQQTSRTASTRVRASDSKQGKKQKPDRQSVSNRKSARR
jgi:AcrR family transcriptional regulator